MIDSIVVNDAPLDMNGFISYEIKRNLYLQEDEIRIKKNTDDGLSFFAIASQLENTLSTCIVKMTDGEIKDFSIKHAYCTLEFDSEYGFIQKLNLRISKTLY